MNARMRIIAVALFVPVILGSHPSLAQQPTEAPIKTAPSLNQTGPAEPKGKMDMQGMDMKHMGHAQSGSQPQNMGKQGSQMEHIGHMNIPTVKPVLPKMGISQENPATPLIGLEGLEQMAAANNPTLAQAQAEILASKARQLQSGLYPNPRVGYLGEEIRGGSFGGGEQGFFLSQTIVTGGKLGLNRKIFGHEIRISEIEVDEQRLRVMNGVRQAYYRVLASQELLDTKKGLAGIAADSVRTAQQLQNIGQADESEVLQGEIEQQRAEMAVRIQENTLREDWRSLAAVVGDPSLPISTVAGDLERDLPDLNEQQVMNALVTEGPAMKIAEAVIDHAKARLKREKREPIPDIEVRGGLQQNRELLEGTSRRVGLQGFAEVGVQLHIFNRNQGNIQAAKAAMERSQRETKRVELALYDRAAAVLKRYQNAKVMADTYRTQILPRARNAYELLSQQYGRMLASYPQVLTSQKILFQLQTEYVAALEDVWLNATTLRGLLLTDGLEAPARPGEVDLPVREINIPAASRTGEK